VRGVGPWNSAPLDPTMKSMVRWLRWLGPAMLVLAALLLLPDLLATIPRSALRQPIEVALRGLLVTYAAAWLLAPLGAVVFGAGLFRARRRGLHQPWLARLALLCGAIVLGLIALEASATFWRARTEHPQAPGSARLLPPHLTPSPPEGPIRLVVIGESSARGWPYAPWLSIGQTVAWQLGEALPRRGCQVEILAENGLSLAKAARKLAGLTVRPDAILIYSGHNEFLNRFDWARNAILEGEPAQSCWDGLVRAGRALPLGRMIAEAIDHNRVDRLPMPSDSRRLVDWPVCSPAEYAAVVADFRRVLESIVSDCERANILPILVIPPGNDADFEPNRSILPVSVPEAQRRAFAEAFSTALAIERDETDRALTLYRSLLAEQPGFAEAHYRLAKLLERSGHWDDARRHYRLARDLDGYPLRCPSSIQNIYHEISFMHDCLLIDGPAVFQAIAPHGLLGDTLFHDAQHPNLRGHVALAEAVLRALRDRAAFGWRHGPAPTLDPLVCAKHFGLDATKWSTVCERTADFLLKSASIRHDPTARAAQADRYTRAARALAAGTPPEAIDLLHLTERRTP
jgi:hypothetical protein